MWTDFDPFHEAGWYCWLNCFKFSFLLLIVFHCCPFLIYYNKWSWYFGSMVRLYIFLLLHGKVQWASFDALWYYYTFSIVKLASFPNWFQDATKQGPIHIIQIKAWRFNIWCYQLGYYPTMGITGESATCSICVSFWNIMHLWLECSLLSSIVDMAKPGGLQIYSDRF